MWLDEMECDLRIMGISGCRRKAEDREEWKRVIGMSRSVTGCCSKGSMMRLI